MILNNLSKSRNMIGLTQKELSQVLNIISKTISGWETGNNFIPIKRLIEYANIYDFSLDYLLGISDKNIKYEKIKLNINVISKNLKLLRKENNYTQKEISKLLNTSQGAYSHYETARQIIPTSFLYGLIKIYKPFSVDKLFNRQIIDISYK